MSDRLWLMHFKAISAPKPRTPKQNAQESQTPTEATTIIKAPATTITTIKKAKGRVLFLERWYQRFNHLNYADVK
jgi:hypothetical protein